MAPKSTILIFRLGSLGDTVVALPCFHWIARSFPDSRRIVITAGSTSQKVTSVESVLGHTGLIHGTIYFRPPPRKFCDLLELRNRIRQTGATTLIYVADRTIASTLRDICFFRICGIRHIIGASLRRRLRYRQYDPRTCVTEREAERLARCLSPLGTIDINDPGMWDLRLQSDELRAADEALSRLGSQDFIAIGLGGKYQVKDWGNDNWSALLQITAAQHSNIALVFVGSSDEFNRSAAIAAHWNGSTLNLCGRLAPRESAALMRRALFYLGHDNGPMHLAAAVGIPCVAIFGPTNMPKAWYPIGARHQILHNAENIREITPEAVSAEINMMMSNIANQNQQHHGAYSVLST